MCTFWKVSRLLRSVISKISPLRGSNFRGFSSPTCLFVICAWVLVEPGCGFQPNAERPKAPKSNADSSHEMNCVRSLTPNTTPQSLLAHSDLRLERGSALSPQLGIGVCSGSSIHRKRPLTSLSMMSITSFAAFSGGSPPVSSTQVTQLS